MAVSKDDKPTWEATKVLRHHIANHWGPRCSTYERVCAVCRMWVIYDDFVLQSRTGLDDAQSYEEKN